MHDESRDGASRARRLARKRCGVLFYSNKTPQRVSRASRTFVQKCVASASRASRASRVRVSKSAVQNARFRDTARARLAAHLSRRLGSPLLFLSASFCTALAATPEARLLTGAHDAMTMTMTVGPLSAVARAAASGRRSSGRRSSGRRFRELALDEASGGLALASRHTDRQRFNVYKDTESETRRFAKCGSRLPRLVDRYASERSRGRAIPDTRRTTTHTPPRRHIRWVEQLPAGRAVAICITDTAIAAKRPPPAALYAALAQLGTC